MGKEKEDEQGEGGQKIPTAQLPHYYQEQSLWPKNVEKMYVLFLLVYLIRYQAPLLLLARLCTPADHARSNNGVLSIT